MCNAMNYRELLDKLGIEAVPVQLLMEIAFVFAVTDQMEKQMSTSACMELRQLGGRVMLDCPRV